MAGESPDRSKQHGSSAEATSGSGASVPGSAGADRDPRLAMAGEKAGVDQATAVFSTRALWGVAGSSVDETGAAPGSAAARAKGAGDDTARRASLASWVRSAEEAEGGSGAGAGVKSGDDAKDAVEGATAGSKSGAVRRASDGTSHGGAEEAASGKAADESAEQTSGKSPEEVDGASSAKAGEEPAEKGAEEALQVERTGDAEAVVEVEETDGAEGESDGPGEAVTEEAREAGAEENSATGVVLGAEDASEDDTEPADSEAGAKDAYESERAPESEVGSQADGKSGAEEASGADGGPESGSEDGSKDGSKDDSEVVTEGENGPAGPKAPVDQPTAVFKVREPAVDQPTTMLKLRDTKPSGENADEPADKAARKPGPSWAAKSPEAPAADKPASAAKSGAGRTAEPSDATSDTERTSKFVALKPLDAAAPTKPKPAAGPAEPTAALPQVGPERTTQQPLPPKPPMDLLAELTNTPPPPPTPVRTIVRRFKIWTPLVVLLAVVFAIAQSLRPLPPPSLSLTAKDTYQFEGDKLTLPWPSEGQGWMAVDGIGEMGHFGKQKPVPIASVTKTMTAYIILRDHPLKPGQEGPKITIDPTAAKEAGYDVTGDESTLNTVKEGDVLTEKQALSAVMIPSANNIARLLARWDAGSTEAFVKKMNDTAKELGMTNTTYTDPSGLTKSTVSTAEDQVKLGVAAMRIPAMVEVTSAASWTDPTNHYWNNYNELPFTIGAIGIKTGSTTAAGGNLLFAAHKEVGGRTVTIVGAILGQYKPRILETVNAVSKTALLAAKKAPTSAKILKKGDVVGYVDDRLGGRTPVVVTKDVTAIGWAGLEVKLSFTSGELPHTAKAGTTVGALTVGDGDGDADGAVKIPVALEKDLVEPGFKDKLTRLG